MALGAKLQHKDCRVYALLGDGECQEGQIDVYKRQVFTWPMPSSIWERAASVFSRSRVSRMP